MPRRDPTLPALPHAGVALVLALLLASGAAFVPATATAQDRGADPRVRNAAVAALFAEYDRPDSPGCIVGVGQAGSVVYRNAFGLANLEHGIPLTPFTVSEIGSVAKQFTAAAVVLLAQDGKLSLDDEVRRHWPEFPDFGAPVTIRMLLNHTSGWRDQFGLLELAGRPMGDVVNTVEEVVDLGLRQRTPNFPPGTQYLYSNTGFTFVNQLVEKVSGQTFAEFTTERIFRPLGMTKTQWRDDHARVVRGRASAYRPDGRGTWRKQMPFSNLHGSGGLLTTVDDLIRWTEALHEDRVGRPGFLAEMTRVGRLIDGRELTYALGIFVTEYRGVKEVSHGGATAGYRAYLAHYPDHRLTVAILCNVSSANTQALARGVTEVFLGDALQPAWSPPEAVPLSAADLELRAGTYHDPVSHQVLRLEARDGRLTGGGLTLIPTGEDRWVNAANGTVFRWAAPSGDQPARFTAEEEGGRTFLARDPISPTAAELQQLAGEYYNAEIGSTVRLVVEEGRLVLRFPPAARMKLEPAFRDAFTAEGRTLIFRRDGRGNAVGFDYHAGRIRNVRFERVR